MPSITSPHLWFGLQLLWTCPILLSLTLSQACHASFQSLPQSIYHQQNYFSWIWVEPLCFQFSKKWKMKHNSASNMPGWKFWKTSDEILNGPIKLSPCCLQQKPWWSLYELFLLFSYHVSLSLIDYLCILHRLCYQTCIANGLPNYPLIGNISRHKLMILKILIYQKFILWLVHLMPCLIYCLLLKVNKDIDLLLLFKILLFHHPI